MSLYQDEGSDYVYEYESDQSDDHGSIFFDDLEIDDGLGAKGETISVDPSTEGQRWAISTLSDTWFRGVKKKECTVFVCEDGQENFAEATCHCGRKSDEHFSQEDTLDGRTHIHWKKAFIKQRDTDAFGKIQFENDNIPALYLRMDEKIQAKDLAYLLKDKLKLTRNNLYIHFLDYEVYGEKAQPNLVNKLQKKLETGLDTLARKTKMLLTSRGLKTDISAHIHAALSKLYDNSNIQQGIIRLAVPMWGLVDEKSLFIQGKDRSKDVKPGGRMKENVLGINLSPHFTHYLFQDDGTYHNNIGHSCSFRKKLQTVLEDIDGKDQTPSVCVMLNGGPKTLNHVLSAMERNVPVILVKGSGGYADKLGDTYLQAQKKPVREMDKDGKIRLKVQLEVEHSEVKGIDQDDHENAKKILKQNHLLTVFDPEHPTQGLDMAICQAFLRGKQEIKLHKILSFTNQQDQGTSPPQLPGTSSQQQQQQQPQQQLGIIEQSGWNS